MKGLHMQSRHYASVFRGIGRGIIQKDQAFGPRRHGDQNYDVFSLVTLSACICPVSVSSALYLLVSTIKATRDLTCCFLSAAAAPAM